MPFSKWLLIFLRTNETKKKILIENGVNLFSCEKRKTRLVALLTSKNTDIRMDRQKLRGFSVSLAMDRNHSTHFLQIPSVLELLGIYVPSQSINRATSPGVKRKLYQVHLVRSIEIR